MKIRILAAMLLTVMLTFGIAEVSRAANPKRVVVRRDWRAPRPVVRVSTPVVAVAYGGGYHGGHYRRSHCAPRHGHASYHHRHGYRRGCR